MQRALLWAGIDAAKNLGRAPLINACLTEPLLFLFGGVDLTLSCLEILDDVHHVLAARRTRLNQSNADYLSGTLKAKRARIRIGCERSARMWISANRAPWSPNGVVNRGALDFAAVTPGRNTLYFPRVFEPAAARH